MKEFIEKLIGRLEEEATSYKNDSDKEYGQGAYEQAKEDMIASVCLRRAIQIVNQLAEEHNNDFCEWKFTKSVADGGYFYSSGCNHKRFSDLHSFEFCPYCGKKIKVVE